MQEEIIFNSLHFKWRNENN